MKITLEGSTAEITVLLNLLEQRPSVLNTNKITEDAIKDLRQTIPEGDNLLLNIFNIKSDIE